MAQIYALFSARDGVVRYVGETSGDRHQRFEEHKRDVKRINSELYGWFHNEWKHGYPIECALLQNCAYQERHRMETDWIAKFPNLFNERKQYGWANQGHPPSVPEIKAYMRKHVFNVNGFCGVHYDVQGDRYFVLIYRRRRPEWLIGDEWPGGGGNIWFSDCASAVKARDKARQWLQVECVADAEL